MPSSAPPCPDGTVEFDEYCSVLDFACHVAAEATCDGSSNSTPKTMLANQCYQEFVQPKLRGLSSELAELPPKELLSTVRRNKSKRADDARQKTLTDPDLLKLILEDCGYKGNNFGAVLRFTQTSKEMQGWIKLARPRIALEGLSKASVLKIQKSGLWSVAQVAFSCYGRLKNIDFLSSFAGLEHLNLSVTGVTTVEPLARLFNLQNLDLIGTGVTTVEPLAGLFNLQSLNLHCTRITTVEPLARLFNLQNLDLSGTGVTTVEPLAGLSNLQSLNLGRSTGVTTVAPLADLVNLEDLDLDYTAITTVEPLAGLSNLQSLNLSRTHVTTVEPLAGLFNLKRLWLSYTGVTTVAPLANLVNLKQLGLSGTNVADVGSLSHLENLRRYGYV